MREEAMMNDKHKNSRMNGTGMMIAMAIGMVLTMIGGVTAVLLAMVNGSNASNLTHIKYMQDSITLERVTREREEGKLDDKLQKEVADAVRVVDSTSDARHHAQQTEIQELTFQVRRLEAWRNAQVSAAVLSPGGG